MNRDWNEFEKQIKQSNVHSVDGKSYPTTLLIVKKSPAEQSEVKIHPAHDIVFLPADEFDYSNEERIAIAEQLMEIEQQQIPLVAQLIAEYHKLSKDIVWYIKYKGGINQLNEDVIKQCRTERRTINQILKAYQNLLLQEGKSFKAYY